MSHKILFFLILAVTVFAFTKKQPEPEPPVIEVQYDGQYKGCIKNFDELFCPDSYRQTNSLQASGDAVEKYILDDEAGMFLILEVNATTNAEVYTKVVPRDK